jgi:putative transposase
MVGPPEPLAERGVLSAPDVAWDVAVHRSAVIGRLAQAGRVTVEAADAAAAELGISRRRVYSLVGRWREGSGLVTDLIVGRSRGGRGGGRLPDEVEAVLRETLRSRYLGRQRRSLSAVHREVARVCRARGLPVPSRGALERRVARLDPVQVVAAREGRDAARALRSAGGVAPAVDRPLEQVQMDHTVVDVVVVDERHRLPLGRPYVTLAIDVFSRAVVGLVVTLEAPSALSVGLCLAHMVTDKRVWLEQLGVDAVWPMLLDSRFM